MWVSVAQGGVLVFLCAVWSVIALQFAPGTGMWVCGRDFVGFLILNRSFGDAPKLQQQAWWEARGSVCYGGTSDQEGGVSGEAGGAKVDDCVINLAMHRSGVC